MIIIDNLNKNHNQVVDMEGFNYKIAGCFRPLVNVFTHVKPYSPIEYNFCN